jgi:CRISPR/Cas system CMR-associated protein Cmr5 small subunit
MKSRSQEMVRALTEDKGVSARMETLKGSRAQNLPALLQRHGLLQVVAFLNAKASAKDGDSLDAKRDRELLNLLQHAVHAVEPEAKLSQADLAKLATDRYLYLHELALEAADWLARLAP